MKTPKISTLFRCLQTILTASVVAVAIGARAQTAPCADTNAVKFYLPPQLNQGFDVKDSRNGIVLADDFYCNSTGPITGIHVWGSWLGDQHGTVTNFWVGIYSDVPAATNFAKGQVTNSHPGSLLWWANFPQGQFSENIYSNNAYEFFYNPTNGTYSFESVVYSYCFFPTNPFVQKGTANAPTNYWLAIRAQLAPDGTLHGWKSASVPYNDPAVWGTVDASGFPSGDWQSLTNPITQQQPLHLSMMLTTPTNPPAQTPCVESNGLKYVQWPDLYSGQGADVWNSSVFPPGVNDGPWWLADDFVCTNTGPITDIHLWGSWQNDSPLVNSITFQLFVMDDVPVNPNNLFSHPGTNILWHQTFAPGSYAENIWVNNANEYFLDPGPPQILGSDRQVWYYCFYPTNLTQYGAAAAPKTYWLVAFAELPAGTANVFGWKTTTNVQNDISVHMKWNGVGSLPTNSIQWARTYEYVTGQGPLDLAFKLNTLTNPPPPQTPCVETNGVKYVQGPNLDGGSDVWNNPYVLADDFVCTNSGPITDVHIWGSWLNNVVGTNTQSFWLGIYDDVPLGGTNTAFSHPGRLLWQQWFGPGQYAENFWGIGSENFLDPGPPQIIGNDQQAWYYCFYPTNPFIQLGSTSAPKVYWLAAYAQQPGTGNYQYGWKTTQLVKNDVSVHAPWPGVPPAGNPGWIPTMLPSGAPVDLAFKINTPTNRCPVPVLCVADKTVECGSVWNFDPPFIGSDPCCPSNPIVTFFTATNSLGPCQQSYTRTWYISDCVGYIGSCSQTVTVEDTNPPVFTSFPTNLIAYTCDTNMQVFWTVTATDACSSVTITSTPPSGFAFHSLSTNTVSVTASDACGNATNKTFTVTVLRPVLSPLFIRYLYITNNPATNKYVLTWTNGILQVSTATNLMNTTNVMGPYVDVPGATSPYTNHTSLPAQFFRLRCN